MFYVAKEMVDYIQAQLLIYGNASKNIMRMKFSLQRVEVLLN